MPSPSTASLERTDDTLTDTLHNTTLDPHTDSSDGTETSGEKTAATAPPSIRKMYNQYFSSGSYKHRYPKPNQHTFAFIQRYLKDDVSSRLVDYGCGNGRYVMPLLLQHPHLQICAFDIAEAPLALLKETLEATNTDIRATLFHSHTTWCASYPEHSFDTALLLFGVLSHITDASIRHTLLVDLRQRLKIDGRLLLSVPNRARRFVSLQRQQNSSYIRYMRQIEGQLLPLEYQLYDMEQLTTELAQAGLDVVESKAESLLPESWITRIPLLGWFDRQCCRWLPTHWGYGFIVCCKASTSAPAH